MNRRWLVLDVNYLAYRALYTTGGLSFEGKPTGVLYGVLREAFYLRRTHQSDYVVWCFDYGKNYRKELAPTYKSNRKPKTPEKEEIIRNLKIQVDQLIFDLIKIAKCPNVFYQDGYEADDCIAKFCKMVNKDYAMQKDVITIVSADKDLYQLLDGRTSIFDPRTQIIMTESGFRKKYEIDPEDWVEVKRIAGCTSDGIKGIPKIGEKTVLKFMTNKLKEGSAARKKVETGLELYKERLNLNGKLVRLPFAGKKYLDKPKLMEFPIVLEPDKSKDEWTPLFRKYNIKSI